MIDTNKPYIIEHPLNETETYILVGIRSGVIRQFHRDNKPMIIECKGFRRIYLRPLEIVRTCESFKQAGNYPDNPMIFFKVFIDKPKGTPEARERELLLEATR